jgi:MFS family permease
LTDSVAIDTVEIDAARRARLGVSGYFAVFGLCSGTWASHIPFAKSELQAGATAFGLALLCMGLGAIVSMPTVSWFINRYGSASVCRATAIGMLLSLLLPFAAPSVVFLGFGLLIFGGFSGALDVAANAHGLIVEKRLGKPVISAFHGLWGAAALIGAASATVLIAHVSELVRAIAICMFCFAALAPIHALMLPAKEDQGKSSAAFALPTRSTVWLGLLALLAMMNEGAVADWAGIYLRDERGTSPQVTTLAFVAFAGCLALSRMIADRARAKWGAAMVTGVCAASAALSLTLAIVTPIVPIALVFFGLVGFFIGPLAPIFYAGGGRVDRENPGRGIGAVVTLGYLGNVIGPPIVGFIADATNLAWSLGLMAVCAAAIALCCRLAAAADG